MRLFLDTSALVKRCIAEPGSERVSELCGNAEEVTLSAFCLPEAVSVFQRLRRTGKARAEDVRTMKDRLAKDLAMATIVVVDERTLGEAVSCLEKQALGASDAIHVASARLASCDLFVSGDAFQCKAARGLGLKTELVGK